MLVDEQETIAQGPEAVVPSHSGHRAVRSESVSVGSREEVLRRDLQEPLPGQHVEAVALARECAQGGEDVFSDAPVFSAQHVDQLDHGAHALQVDKSRDHSYPHSPLLVSRQRAEHWQ